MYIYSKLSRGRLYFRIEGVTSQTFAFKGLDGVERCRTFHVYRDRQGAPAEEEPKFVQAPKSGF